MLNPLKSWRKFHEDWRMKTPKQKWFFIYGIGAKICDSMGVRVYSDMKNYWYSYFNGFIGIIYLGTLLYTLWFYFVKGEFARGLQCTCTIGIVFSVKEIFPILVSQAIIFESVF